MTVNYAGGKKPRYEKKNLPMIETKIATTTDTIIAMTETESASYVI